MKSVKQFLEDYEEDKLKEVANERKSKEVKWKIYKDDYLAIAKSIDKE